jgi:hypothetical protein
LYEVPFHISKRNANRIDGSHRALNPAAKSTIAPLSGASSAAAPQPHLL